MICYGLKLNTTPWGRGATTVRGKYFFLLRVGEASDAILAKYRTGSGILSLFVHTQATFLTVLPCYNAKFMDQSGFRNISIRFCTEAVRNCANSTAQEQFSLSINFQKNEG